MTDERKLHALRVLCSQLLAMCTEDPCHCWLAEEVLAIVDGPTRQAQRGTGTSLSERAPKPAIRVRS